MELTYDFCISEDYEPSQLKTLATQLTQQIADFTKLANCAFWDNPTEKEDDYSYGTRALLVHGHLGDWESGECIDRTLISKAVFKWCKSVAEITLDLLPDDEPEDIVDGTKPMVLKINDCNARGGMRIMTYNRSGLAEFGLMVLPYLDEDESTSEKDEAFSGYHKKL